MDGSAPAVEREPPAAATVFGDGLTLARRYAGMLAGPGVRRGLIGPREAGRLWSRHLLNCAVLGELLPSGGRLVDIGSGAGLPGIPLALARPDWRVDLVEPMLRRTSFLDEVVTELGLANCRVLRARAEEAAGSVGGADVVTARAVALLGRLAGWAAPLLRPGGVLLALKGASAAEELSRDGGDLRAAGLRGAEIVHAGTDLLDAPVTVVRAVRR